MADSYFGKKGGMAKPTERKEDESNTPKVGFSSAPANEQNLFEPCKGFGGSNAGAR